MKLKRLIAIAVALATLLSCGCFAGSTVYAADADTDVYTIYNWDGMLVRGNKTFYEAVVGRRYTMANGRNEWSDGVKGTATKGDEGYYMDDGTFGALSGDNRVRNFWPAGKLTDASLSTCFSYYKSAYESTGSIATLEENDNYYYEITYPVFRSSGFITNVSGGYANFNLSDDVFSVSYDLRIPTESVAEDRYIFYQNVSSTDGSASLLFTTKYDATTGCLDLGASDTFTELWANTVEVDADTWYTVDTRYALVDDLLLAGVFVNDTQVACYQATDSAAFADGGLTLNNMAVGRYSSSTQDLKVPDSVVHYDDILFSVLGDYANCAPSAEEPTVEPPVDPEEPEDPEDPEVPAANDVKYGAPVVEETSFSVNAVITGFGNVTGNVNAFVAIFNPSNGRVARIVPTTVDTGSYVAGETRNMTVSIDGVEVEAGAPIKVFFFNSLTSPTPLLPNFDSTK